MPDEIPDEFVAALLATSSRRGHFGARLLYFNDIGSTNDEAARLAEDGAPEGTTVAAGSQHAGRGRFGRTWFSPPGAGLYASVVIRNVAAAPLLTLAGGVAIADALRHLTSLPAEIKWPNDIVIEAGLGRRRKLAGILAEGTSAGDGLQHVVLGFGVNILRSAYPLDLGNSATSLEVELGRPVSAAAVFAECLAMIAERMHELSIGQSERVLGRWAELSPSSRGRRVEWATAVGTQSGVTAGIDADGALLVRRGAEVERIVSGTVQWV
jgi:BirA family transcriptional regulator, biotin operon repressor / biotin---[acetyl-CoA-carboxylase] ligase